MRGGELLFGDMDNKSFKSSRSKWFVLMAALGFTSYSVYRVYHSPSTARKRAKLSKFLAAFSTAAAAFSDSADCLATISNDLKEFLHSDSDEIPRSFKQISKLARSDEISDSFTRLSQAFTLGVLRGFDQSHPRGSGDGGGGDESSYGEKIMKLLNSESGSGFVSVVVGSFARNLVMGFDSANKSAFCAERLMDIAREEKSRELIGEMVRTFVSTAVTVYLEKTISVNAFDQIFSGLTNPKHEKEMRELLVSLSNGAVKTLIKTSHQVMLGHGESGPGPLKGKKVEEFEDVKLGLKPNRPRNSGKVMMNLTGKVTFEMVRAFMEVLLEKVYKRMKRCVDIVYEEVIERGMEMVRYVTVKTSVIASVCLSLCLHVLDSSSWFLLAY